jgi:metal-responsive CopG/Arc/MetJ family transcriptional regulator
MAKPGPKKRFDGHIGIPIESEYIDAIDAVADQIGANRATVVRRLIRENLGELVKEDTQMNLMEEFRNGT